ncbi:MAG TPA: KGK domain protein [Cyanobacteria bacterium UBA11372]|nr:KGK domain protein [Cyanobacteria bacterium UBA11372]
MKDNSFLPEFGEDDVLSFPAKNQPLMFRVGNFREALKTAFRDNSQVRYALCEILKSQGFQVDTIGTWSEYNFYTDGSWFEEGIGCQSLKIGAKGWQKGKIKLKVCLEFIPDASEVEKIPDSSNLEITEPESPLDDLRQMLNQENQH